MAEVIRGDGVPLGPGHKETAERDGGFFRARIHQRFHHLGAVEDVVIAPDDEIVRLGVVGSADELGGGAVIAHGVDGHLALLHQFFKEVRQLGQVRHAFAGAREFFRKGETDLVCRPALVQQALQRGQDGVDPAGRGGQADAHLAVLVDGAGHFFRTGRNGAVLQQLRIPAQAGQRRVLGLHADDGIPQGGGQGLLSAGDDVKAVRNLVALFCEEQVLNGAGLVGGVVVQGHGFKAVVRLAGVQDGDPAPRGAESVAHELVGLIGLAEGAQALGHELARQVFVPAIFLIPVRRDGHGIDALQDVVGGGEIAVIHAVGGQQAVRLAAQRVQGNGLADMFQPLGAVRQHHGGLAVELVLFRGAHVGVLKREQAWADGLGVIVFQEIFLGDVVDGHAHAFQGAGEYPVVALLAGNFWPAGGVQDSEVMGDAHLQAGLGPDAFMDGAFPVDAQAFIRIAAEDALPGDVAHPGVLDVVIGDEQVPFLQALLSVLDGGQMGGRLVVGENVVAIRPDDVFPGGHGKGLIAGGGKVIDMGPAGVFGRVFVDGKFAALSCGFLEGGLDVVVGLAAGGGDDAHLVPEGAGGFNEATQNRPFTGSGDEGERNKGGIHFFKEEGRVHPPMHPPHQ